MEGAPGLEEIDPAPDGKPEDSGTQTRSHSSATATASPTVVRELQPLRFTPYLNLAEWDARTAAAQLSLGAWFE